MRVQHLFAFILIAVTASASATPRPNAYDDRVPYGARHERGRPGEQQWTQLATNTPTRFGTEYFVMPRFTPWVRTLRITATSGTVVVRNIEIVTREHVSKTFRVDRRLDRYRPTAYVDLGVPYKIDQLSVTTNRRPAGTYVVYGSPAPLPVVREVAAR